MGCVSPVDKEKTASEVVADGGVGDGVGVLKWYTTCGDPACGGHRPQQGVNNCTSQKEGDSCTNEGEKCDPVNSCNSLLSCSKTDPKQQVGGCPISTRRLKREIRYLGQREQEAIHRDLMRFRLATYRYTFDPKEAKKHLGFILEDQPGSPAVDAKRNMVDLYQYTSMVVAAMQTQARKMEAQARKMEAQTRVLEAQARKMEAQAEEIKKLRGMISDFFTRGRGKDGSGHVGCTQCSR